MAYIKTNWQNTPSTATPLSATNLNKLETQYDAVVSDISDVASPVGSALAATIDTRAGTVVRAALQPAIVGDGTANDAAAINAMFGLAGDVVQFESGKTYKASSAISITKDVDLNGATLNIAGRLNLASGKTVKNGTVIVSDKINAVGLTDVAVENVLVQAGTSSDGISFTDCDGVRISGCKVEGGKRGIVLTACDNFLVENNDLSEMTVSGSYGILVAGRTGEVHGDGTIRNNTVNDAFFGICGFGGEADPAKPGFAPDYTLANIDVYGNRVRVSTPDTMIGCIYFTRSRDILIHDNIVIGGYDVGVDFEYCRDCIAENNDVVDIFAGGLAAIFGSSNIDFNNNRVSYRRMKAGSAGTVGTKWKNTSNVQVLLRDNPKHITFRGNTFESTNGGLGKFEMGAASDTIEVLDNKLLNVYVAGNNPTAGQVKRTIIADNTFVFDIALNNSAIYHERVLDFVAEGNRIYLSAGEVPESEFRYYIEVRDAAGGGASDLVYLLRNRVSDAGANHGIGFHTVDPAARAWIIGNETDRITALFSTGTYTALVFDKNYRQSSPAIATLTAHDNAGVEIVTRPYQKVEGDTLDLRNGAITYRGLTAFRVDLYRNASFGTSSPSYGAGQGVVFLANAAQVPTTDPSGGGILFIQAGALKYRGSSGTVTTIGPA